MMDENQVKVFEAQIKKDIPLTRELDFSFETFEKNEIILSAPYKCNKNDKNTVFAGSQASLALLAGWCLVSLSFKKEGVNVAAAVKTEMHYRKPLETDFKARARFSDKADIQLCNNTIKKKGRAKVLVEVELSEIESGEVGAVFTGSYFISKS